MRSPVFDTSNRDHDQEQNQEQVEAVLPGLVGRVPRLHEKGRPETRVIAHGYVSRGGAKRGSMGAPLEYTLMKGLFNR